MILNSIIMPSSVITSRINDYNEIALGRIEYFACGICKITCKNKTKFK